MLGHSTTLASAIPDPGKPARADRPVRVMIVDDSAVVRGLVARWIGEEPGLELVACHPNGRLAVADVARSAPDIVVLDIEMPVMDGLETLPLLLRAKPGVRVVMASTLTQRNAEISFRALSLGALDYVPKPDSNRGITLSPEFREELIRKLKGLGHAWPGRRAKSDRVEGAPGGAAAALPSRPFSLVPPRIIAIGSSTGGPQALEALLAPLAAALTRVPVVIAQHMPPMFTAILAGRLARSTGKEAKEAADGEALKPATIYVAPGGRHMIVAGADEPILRLQNAAPVHHCRPAIDPLFASVAGSHGAATLGIVLTGMGADGAVGARAIAEAGGSVMAQDEASSVVWGMPSAAAAAGACSALLPPAGIADMAAKLIRGERP
jgi:two-component system chemotaxis response regulator CheB